MRFFQWSFKNKINYRRFRRYRRVMYDGWRVPLVCGIKWKCLAAGGIGETPRISTVSRRECENESEQGSHPDLPLCTTVRTESNVSYSYAKKAPIYFSGRSRIGTIYIGVDKIQRWLMKSSLFFLATRCFHRFKCDTRYARCCAYSLTIILLLRENSRKTSLIYFVKNVSRCYQIF